MIKTAQIAIVGGGMVGNACAATLAALGFDVCVIEATPPKEFKADDPLELRVSAISLGSQSLLENCGVWRDVVDTRAVAYRKMRVWDQPSGSEVCFDSADIDQPQLGHIVENRLLQSRLYTHCQSNPKIEYIGNTKLKSMRNLGAYMALILDNGQQLRAQLVIGADGAGSAVREFAGIDVERYDYSMQALVATVQTDYPQQDVTWQRFTAHGPEAFLPLSGAHGSLVWYHDAEEISRLKSLSEDAFLQQLHQRFPKELGTINAVLGRGSFPLRKQHAKRYVAPRVVLVGDAAHSLHPLAGQGVNLGLMDVAALAEHLYTRNSRDADLGQLNRLLGYERARRLENTMMLQLMHLFAQGFGDQGLIASWVRSQGLELAQRSGKLKSHVTRLAMGVGATAPKLATGLWP